MIIQAVVAVFAGIAFFIRSNWNKIRGIKDESVNDDAASEGESSSDDKADKAS